MSWKRRLAIFISVTWFVLVLGVSSGEVNNKQILVTFGILPLTIVWGIWWVITGAKSKVLIPPYTNNTDSNPEVKEAFVIGVKSTKDTDINPRNWMSKVVSTLAFVISFALVKYYMHRENYLSRTEAAIERGDVLNVLQVGNKDAYEIIKTGSPDSLSFKNGMIKSFEATYSNQATGTSVKVTSTTTQDFLSFFLIRILYEGVMKFDGVEGLYPIRGESRRFYTHHGMIQLEGLCALEKSICNTLQARLDESELKVMASIGRTDLESMLPSGNGVTCNPFQKVSSVLFGKEIQVETANCLYEEAIVLAYTRYTNEQVRAMMQAMSSDAKGKEILKSFIH